MVVLFARRACRRREWKNDDENESNIFYNNRARIFDDHVAGGGAGISRGNIERDVERHPDSAMSLFEALRVWV